MNNIQNPIFDPADDFLDHVCTSVNWKGEIQLSHKEYGLTNFLLNDFIATLKELNLPIAETLKDKIALLSKTKEQYCCLVRLFWCIMHCLFGSKFDFPKEVESLEVLAISRPVWETTDLLFQRCREVENKIHEELDPIFLEREQISLLRQSRPVTQNEITGGTKDLKTILEEGRKHQEAGRAATKVLFSVYQQAALGKEHPKLFIKTCFCDSLNRTLFDTRIQHLQLLHEYKQSHR